MNLTVFVKTLTLTPLTFKKKQNKNIDTKYILLCPIEEKYQRFVTTFLGEMLNCLSTKMHLLIFICKPHSYK